LAIAVLKSAHHCGVCCSALNGEMTTRPSGSLRTDLDWANSAIDAASDAGVAFVMDVMSGMRTMPKPGSTVSAALELLTK